MAFGLVLPEQRRRSASYRRTERRPSPTRRTDANFGQAPSRYRVGLRRGSQAQAEALLGHEATSHLSTANTACIGMDASVQKKNRSGFRTSRERLFGFIFFRSITDVITNASLLCICNRLRAWQEGLIAAETGNGALLLRLHTKQYFHRSARVGGKALRDGSPQTHGMAARAIDREIFISGVVFL